MTRVECDRCQALLAAGTHPRLLPTGNTYIQVHLCHRCQALLDRWLEEWLGKKPAWPKAV